MKGEEIMSGNEKPKWLNINQYPFEDHFFKTEAGKIHYLDEGEGDAVVFIHGNPSWSFEFRNLIKELRNTNRCIAPDHLGFGLSDKPLNWSYRPKDHAKNLSELLNSLNLKNITLVVGDWGGPIGLSYAINNPEKIKNLVITNTWFWSVNNELYYQFFSKFAGGFVGRYLIKKSNFFAKYILNFLYGDKKRLTAEIHNHYLMPLINPKERKGNWTFPKEIIDSSKWLESIWNKCSVLKDKNVIIAWGMKDIAFREKELKRCIKAFPGAGVIRFQDAGHFLAEEKAIELIYEIKKII